MIIEEIMIIMKSENGENINIDPSEQSIFDFCLKNNLAIRPKFNDKFIWHFGSRSIKYNVAGVGTDPKEGEQLWFFSEEKGALIGFFSLLKHMLETGKLEAAN